MNDRVILAVKFTPAGSAGQVRKAVGGFLRYVQHRDLHPTQPEGHTRPEVGGLLKYVAYRDGASSRAELFGPSGPLSSNDRKVFAAFVANALDKSSPQLYRGRDGQLHERRRAVYRFVISPERAEGLDLGRLTTAAIGRLEWETGMTGLRWIAAIHRNTAHHHVHLVLAGMHQDEARAHRRVDITKPRLAAMKEELAHEIDRQRAERMPARSPRPAAAEAKAAPSIVALQPAPPLARQPKATVRAHKRGWHRSSAGHGSVTALRLVARRYQRRMERELEESSRQGNWELVA